MPETIRARFPDCLGLVLMPEHASHSARLLTGWDDDAFYGAAAAAYLTMSYAKDGLELPCDDDAFLTCRASRIHFLFFKDLTLLHGEASTVPFSLRALPGQSVSQGDSFALCGVMGPTTRCVSFSNFEALLWLLDHFRLCICCFFFLMLMRVWCHVQDWCCGSSVVLWNQFCYEETVRLVWTTRCKHKRTTVIEERYFGKVLAQSVTSKPNCWLMSKAPFDYRTPCSQLMVEHVWVLSSCKKLICIDEKQNMVFEIAKKKVV